MATPLTREQIADLADITEGLYGDSKEDLWDAVRALLSELTQAQAKEFLKGTLVGTTPEDWPDKDVYKRTQILINTL